MSFFVLVYDRSQQMLIDLKKFEDTERAGAEAFRHQAQRRALTDNLDQEIVLFQAHSEEALRRSHGSYFLSEEELLNRARRAVEAS